jgi:hypothetical protein
MGGALALGMGERRGTIFSSSIQDGWKKTSTKAIPCDPLKVGSLHRKEAKPLKCLIIEKERIRPDGFVVKSKVSLSLSLLHFILFVPFLRRGWGMSIMTTRCQCNNRVDTTKAVPVH